MLNEDEHSGNALHNIYKTIAKVQRQVEDLLDLYLNVIPHTMMKKVLCMFALRRLSANLMTCDI